MSIDIRIGDCLDLLRQMPSASVDSVVTDPPYGLTTARPTGRSAATEGAVMKGFMGLEWDGDVPSVEVWAECLRILKPGGHLLSFAGTRTQHRMATRIEDAGFEIRDMIMWTYGSGFPKSHNLGDEWEGWGTALKPAVEPITVARKPLAKGCTVAGNVLAHGTGALNIDGCRVPATDNTTKAWRDAGDRSREQYRTGTSGRPVPTDQGRWPANLIHDGSEEVVERFPTDAGAAAPVHRRGSDKFRTAYGAFKGNTDEAGSTFRDDRGSAARFFYCAKASRSERGEGNTHPTVKPLALMRYLVRLVTAPGGLVLDPFAGSGTTGLAAQSEGMRAILCELDPGHAAIIRSRAAKAQSEAGLFAWSAE